MPLPSLLLFCFSNIFPFDGISLGSGRVYTIKQGSQVITTHCQTQGPVIQMQSEVSKRSVPFAGGPRSPGDAGETPATGTARGCDSTYITALNGTFASVRTAALQARRSPTIPGVRCNHEIDLESG